MRSVSSAAAARSPIKRCAIYTRKSTTLGLEQEFNTLDAQREACEAYIRAQAGSGWIALEEHYDDGGFTGANIDRPAFQRLLREVEAGRVDAIVVYKLDRISRSLLDFATVMNRLTKAGVGFVSVTQNFSTTDAVGRMTLNLLATFAEFEREQIGERTRDKISASRRRGKWTGGQLPLGYRLVDKKLKLIEEEAALVREVFRLYLEHRSVLVVSQILSDRGYTTKHHIAETGRVREPRAWTKGDVLAVLRQTLYAGFMRSRGELFAGEHESIVDRQTFEVAKATLDAAGGTRTPRRRNPEYLLSGILFCARCGAALTAATTRKGGGTYRYYRCVTRDQKGKRACVTKPVAGPVVEEFVAERLREAIQQMGLAEVAAARSERLVSRWHNLDRERRRLMGAVSRSCDEESERRLIVVEKERVGLESVKAEAAWIAQCLNEFGAIWDVLIPVNRGRLFRAVIERVDVDDASGEVRTTMIDFGEEIG